MSFRIHYPKLRSLATWVLVAAALGCVAEAREKDPAKPVPPPPSAAHNVVTPKDEPRPAAPRDELTSGVLELAGDLRPDQSADLGFKIGGQLLTVRVKRGERVKRGQVLATLSAAEARAQLAQADAALQQAKAQVELAQDNEARAASLVAANAAPGSQATAVRLQTRIAEAAHAQALA